MVVDKNGGGMGGKTDAVQQAPRSAPRAAKAGVRRKTWQVRAVVSKAAKPAPSMKTRNQLA
jgi:hypothetical protein